MPLGIMDRSVPSGSHICAFSTDDILTFWGQGISKAEDSGVFALLRATGDMPSVLNHPDGRTEFFRFEAMLDQFSSPLPLVVL